MAQSETGPLTLPKSDFMPPHFARYQFSGIQSSIQTGTQVWCHSTPASPCDLGLVKI
jgi:hypothetical protein